MNRLTALSVKARLGLLVLLALTGVLLVAGVGLFGLHQNTLSARIVTSASSACRYACSISS